MEAFYRRGATLLTPAEEEVRSGTAKAAIKRTVDEYIDANTSSTSDKNKVNNDEDKDKEERSTNNGNGAPAPTPPASASASAAPAARPGKSREEVLEAECLSRLKSQCPVLRAFGGDAILHFDIDDDLLAPHTSTSASASTPTGSDSTGAGSSSKREGGRQGGSENRETFADDDAAEKQKKTDDLVLTLPSMAAMPASVPPPSSSPPATASHEAVKTNGPQQKPSQAEVEVEAAKKESPTEDPKERSKSVSGGIMALHCLLKPPTEEAWSEFSSAIASPALRLTFLERHCTRLAPLLIPVVGQGINADHPVPSTSISTTATRECDSNNNAHQTDASKAAANSRTHVALLTSGANDWPFTAIDCVMLRQDGSLLDRVLFGYNVMVRLFGWRVHDDKTHELDRDKDTWRDRYARCALLHKQAVDRYLLQTQSPVERPSSSDPAQLKADPSEGDTGNGSSNRGDDSAVEFEASPYHHVTTMIRCMIDFGARPFAKRLVFFLLQEFKAGRLCELNQWWCTVWLPMVTVSGRKETPTTAAAPATTPSSSQTDAVISTAAAECAFDDLDDKYTFEPEFAKWRRQLEKLDETDSE